MNHHVTTYIEKSPQEQRDIMEAIRSLIHQQVAHVTENFKWSRPIFGSPKPFAYLKANKNHVNLGFYSGFEKLADHENLLEGMGTTMRHIKIKKVSDIDTERLSEWFITLTAD